METLNPVCIQNWSFAAFNILKSLASSRWGRDPQILLMFYKFFMRGIMDYGSILYANAPESTLAFLDWVQNQGLKFTLEATKTTPIPALQYESKILPFSWEESALPNNTFLKRSLILQVQTYLNFFIPRDSRKPCPFYPKSSKKHSP